MATETNQSVKTRVQLPKVLILVIIMPWFLLMIGFGFFLLGQKMFKSNSTGGSDITATAPGKTYALKEFIVNLADGDHHLKAGITIQMVKGASVEELKPYEAKIRYVVLANLRNNTVKTLSGANGLEGLRYKLKSVINRVVPGNKVYDVLITDIIWD